MASHSVSGRRRPDATLWAKYPSTVYMIVVLACVGASVSLVSFAIFRGGGGLEGWLPMVVFPFAGAMGLAYAIADDKSKGPRAFTMTKDIVLSAVIIGVGCLMAVGFAIIILIYA